jgi:peptide/nickel transport system permease protein
MTLFCLRRFFVAVLLVFTVSSAALLLTRLAPGDVTSEQILEIDAATRARLRAEAGLDQPILQQYARWIGGAARLDFGRSLIYSRPVAEMVGERLVNTAVLGFAALVLATIIGLPLGIVSGSSTNALSRVIRVASLVCLSVPPLVASLALVLVAARTGWWPIGGMTSSAAADLSWSAWLVDLARHLPVPAFALALPIAATLERVQAQSVADAMEHAFVRAGLARGITRTRAILAHAWRGSLGPVLGLYGVVIGSLFSGSFIVEIVTSWPGLGRLLFDALRARDLYLVAGCVAAGAVVLAIGTFMADVLHAWVDPRVRTGTRS